MNRKLKLLLAHGGRLNQAVKQFGIEKEAWLDLSTGINPNGWPVPLVPEQVYNRLPEADDGLIEVAQAYYNSDSILPVSGSQEAIQRLPEIFQHYGFILSEATIGVISPCYAEHEYQWQKHYGSIVHLTSEMVSESIDSLDVLIIVNPNNPTGEVIAPELIRTWQIRLEKRGGFMIIDEAFMDSTPEKSILSYPDQIPDNLIVLRSVGKFFGLAGIRCGFVIAQPEILSLLEYHQGPWSVSGPTRWIVKQALSDEKWIAENRLLLISEAARLDILLKQCFMTENDTKEKNRQYISGTNLFKTVLLTNAEIIFQELAQNGVLVRLLDNKKGLRFGLPKNKQQWSQLKLVLGSLN